MQSFTTLYHSTQVCSIWNSSISIQSRTMLRQPLSQFHGILLNFHISVWADTAQCSPDTSPRNIRISRHLEIWKFRISKYSEFQNIQIFRISEFQNFQTSGNLEFQSFRIPEFQNFQTSGDLEIWNSRNSDFQKVGFSVCFWGQKTKNPMVFTFDRFGDRRNL